MAEQSVPLDARLLGEAIDAAWDSEIHQPLHSVDQGRGYFQLRPAPGLAARVAAEYARLVPQPARPADTALLRHRIHYLFSVEVGIQRADQLWPEIDALLEDV